MIDANKQLKIKPNLKVSKTKYFETETWKNKLWKEEGEDYD